MIPIALAILLSAVAADAGGVELTLLDGTKVAGSITGWSAQGVEIGAADSSQTVDRKQLLDIRWRREPATTATKAQLSVDSSTARSSIAEYSAAERIATIQSRYADGGTSSGGKLLKIPANRIRRVHLMPPTDASATVWQQLDDRELAGDILLIAKRDGGQIDYLSGVVGDVTADEVAFDYEGDKLPVKRTKVAAIGYYHAQETRLPESVCELTLVGGWKIPARTISLADDGALRVVTPAAVRLRIPIEDLARADFSAGKLAYLSDFTPEKIAWTPRIGAPSAAELIAGYGRPRSDASYSGSALTLAWADESSPTGQRIVPYARGVALRSRTEATYRIPAGMRRFTATAGIDPATANQGHVMLEIRADDRVLWEGEIDGKRDPVAIDLDLGAARRLQLRVDYGRNLDYGDRLHLVEARMTK